MIKITIEPDDVGTRLDRLIRRHHKNLVQSVLEKALRKKQILLDDQATTANCRPQAGQVITIKPEILGGHDEQLPSLKKKYIPTKEDVQELRDSIIFSNEDFVVINKPAGLAVQGGSKIGKNLDDILPSLFDVAKLVHRLDKETSGILLIARNHYGATELTRGFRDKLIQKKYWAIVAGKLQPTSGQMTMPIEEQPAVTHYKVLKHLDGMSWVELEPITGRKHQLRIHLADVGHPILGDDKYGKREGRQLHLHARQINFTLRGQEYEFIAEAPLYIAEKI
jgi:23S rRNA pseudouridine955/2504/2580 synthase